jgi:actin-like ATPase involved in cell morphogenesis
LLPVQVVEDPLSCVVLGAGKMLNDDRLLKKLSLG